MTSMERRRLVVAEMGLGPLWVRRDAAEAGGERTDNQHETAMAIAVAEVASVPDADAARSFSAADHLMAVAPVPADAVAACPDCGFHHEAASVARADGSPRLPWLVVVDQPEHAPGDPAATDRLLHNMLLSLNLRHGQNASVVQLQRSATQSTSQMSSLAHATNLCPACLQQQIGAIRPALILVMGKIAATSLLGMGSDTPLADLRGAVHRYQGLPLVVTHHPSHLLRQASDKAEVWSDFCLVMETHAKHPS